MNIKNLFSRSKPQKLNTTTRRATMTATEDYETDEPNVRLSRAFLVVMLLHVVAVGGIFAFSSLKKSAPPIIDNPVSEAPAKLSDLPEGSRQYTVLPTDTLGSIASSFGLTRHDLETANQLKESSAIRPGDRLIIPAKSTAKAVPLDVQKLLQLSRKPDPVAPKKDLAAITPKTARDVSPARAADPLNTEKFYVVQKGDNPVGIAKKMNVKYADLLSVNKITDPKKLQIGQKLIVPQK